MRPLPLIALVSLPSKVKVSPTWRELPGLFKTRLVGVLAKIGGARLINTDNNKKNVNKLLKFKFWLNVGKNNIQLL